MLEVAVQQQRQVVQGFTRPSRETRNKSPYIHSFILLRVYKSNNNNNEQTVGQDSKATRDALITGTDSL